MMADEIKTNDVVKLKSGGPDMTVARLEVENGAVNAVCGWFDGKEDRIRTFPIGMLKHAE